MLQTPSLPTLPVPAATSSTYTVTVLSGSAVPVKLGVLSLVTLFVPPMRVGAGGVAGAAVSIVRSKGVEGGLVLPAGSVAVTVMLWLPSASGSVGVMLRSV